MRSIVIALAVAFGARAECPNACSGHGTCSLHDQCTCCRDYAGSDCSERVCQFGFAHVDSPLGDIDGSTGTLSGPDDVLIKGSNIYPFGTTEQFPNTAEDEGHHYMECSNKGLCNREDGTCECFPGYEGSSCQRASCPNDCSGHGTCETIKELAEDKEDGDLSFGAYGMAGYADYAAGTGDLSAFGSLKYELWDKQMTLGCKCDPGFTGPDCSLKLCRYGVDPLFIPSTHKYSTAGTDSSAWASPTVNMGISDWAIVDDDGLSDSAPMYEKSFVEIVATEKDAADMMSGTFDLIIYDVYGEKYTLDKLQYSHYDEMVISPGWDHNFGEYGRNHTSCAEIMSYFPNDKLKDTTLGSWQNQMQHKGGLVSTAYVGGATKPFCDISAPRGQNNTKDFGGQGAGTQRNGYEDPVHAQTFAVPANADCALVSVDVLVDATTITTTANCDNTAGVISSGVAAGFGNFIVGDTIYVFPAAGTDGATAYAARAGAGAPNAAITGEFMLITAISTQNPAVLTVTRGYYDMDGTTTPALATLVSPDSIIARVERRVTETFGIRYNFDYNRGNPGYHKDLYIENVIPSPGKDIPVTAFYGTLKQGMVAEIRGDDADDRRAKTYDITLPGYVVSAVEGGKEIIFSKDMSQYLAGTDETINSGGVVGNGNIPDHKTSHIYMLGYYYEIKTTSRVVVEVGSAVPKYSDYMIGERDIATNATIFTFATLAELQTDNLQTTKYANALGATPDDEDAGRHGCTKTDKQIALDIALTTYNADESMCGNTGTDIAGMDGANSPADQQRNPLTLATTSQFVADLVANVAGDVEVLDLGAANTAFARGDAIQVAADTEILMVLSTDITNKLTVMRGAHGTAPATGLATNVINKLNRDHGDAGIATTTATVDKMSNYKNGISFLHSTEGLHQHFCMGTYVEKIENGMYKCKVVGSPDPASVLITNVAGEVRIPVKAKLSEPYQYVSECSGRGSCDREAGVCRCYTGYTHDNCDTQTPVC